MTAAAINAHFVLLITNSILVNLFLLGARSVGFGNDIAFLPNGILYRCRISFTRDENTVHSQFHHNPNS